MRVILRVREADFEEDDMLKPVRLYLKMGRSVREIEENRHYVHFQPSNAHIPQRDPKIHIIIDLNHAQFPEMWWMGIFLTRYVLSDESIMSCKYLAALRG